MRKVWLLVAVMFLVGCTVRTYKIEKPRVDRDITGNQGFLFGMGEPKRVDPDKAKRLSDKRRLTVMELELGFGHPKSMEELEGYAEGTSKYDISAIEEIEEVKRAKRVRKPKAAYTLYTVQKKDTLQKISRRFYGTTKKWKMIYEYNKDKIKNPNKIYPGLKIKVPHL
ncbi:MAG: LysM peptidoglycan-binding domain-containing protein [Candidatus Omnitrophota bacterium]|nr:MAG: LysM peptidoglycan-binding domain-containing protein [Candidatus Omnitrophota bacterium]